MAKQGVTQVETGRALGVEQVTISNSLARFGMKLGRDRDHGKRRRPRKTDPKAAWTWADGIGRRSPLSQPTPGSRYDVTRHGRLFEPASARFEVLDPNEPVAQKQQFDGRLLAF
jgi:hypothetical protein